MCGKKGKELAVQIYGITQKEPFNRDYGFKDQIFYMAKGSLAELQTQLEIACAIGYLDEQLMKELEGKCQIVGKMLGSLIKARSYIKAE
ncbi:four helix bundle protein [Dehalococcoidia bacterium]|nr:four helix bundle protein [Dehalococcoidia bacterium]